MHLAEQNSAQKINKRAKITLCRISNFRPQPHPTSGRLRYVHVYFSIFNLRPIGKMFTGIYSDFI